MDLGLPVLDGWEAARRLKADWRPRPIPVIALSAHAMSDDRSQALEAGCDEYDVKPVEWPRLLTKIRALLPAGGRAMSDAAILVVDDDDNNRFTLVQRLEARRLRERHRRRATARGALARLAERPFDLVLLDVMMPELDGIGVLTAMKADPLLRHVPVVMISAVNDLERVVRCIELGAEDYLPKPFNKVLLRARVRACLEKKRLRDQEQAHSARSSSSGAASASFFTPSCRARR